MRLSKQTISCTLGAMVIGLIAGCAGRPQIFPNSDPNLRKSSAQFAADAAKRHPYKADAPRGGELAARAQVGYMADQLEIANLSDQDWDDVEVWVNKKYVCFIPKMEKGATRVKVLNFRMLFDESGNSFPTDNTVTHVDSVEIYKDGKMYDVTTKLAD